MWYICDTLCNAKDENAIYELLCELEGMSLDKEGFHEAYRDYMKDDKMHCLVAEMDKEVVGVLNLRISTMLCRCGKIGEIVELAVRNGMRSQGIGHGLFRRRTTLPGKPAASVLRSAPTGQGWAPTAFMREREWNGVITGSSGIFR